MLSGELSGSASSLLVPGLRHLAPQEAAFGMTLRGWEVQQGSRRLKAATVSMRRDVARQPTHFTDRG